MLLSDFAARKFSLPYRLLTGWVQRNALWWRLGHALVAAMILCWLQKPFFYSIATDGFTVGVIFIDSIPLSRLWEHPLYFVHAMRYAAVVLLWKVHEFGWAPLANAVFILGLLWPIVMIPIRRKVPPSPWRVALFYMPCIFSMRSVMVMVGVAYLFVLFTSRYRSRLMFIISALCANLSSAGVLVWLIASAGNWKYLRSLRVVGVVVALLMAASLTVSIMHKYQFFHEDALKVQEVAVQTHSNPVTLWLADMLGMGAVEAAEKKYWLAGQAFFVATIIDRSTVVISLTTGYYLRAYVYMAIFCLYVFCLVISSRGGRFEAVTFRFLAFCFPIFLTEGLGVIALVSPMMLFLLERTPGSYRLYWRKPEARYGRQAAAA